MLNRLRTVVAVAMLTVAGYAASTHLAVEHPDTYVVRKGDTLWDIAAHLLGKPWLWPEIWQANPQVHNPHLIYPGDVLSLAYLDRVAHADLAPGPRQDAPIDAIPLAQVEPFLKNLRVVERIEGLPYVVGMEGNRLRATTGQRVYAVGLREARVGQRYAVVRPSVRYVLPRLRDDLTAEGRSTPGSGTLWRSFVPPDRRREVLGYELAQVNIGTVTGGAGDGRQATALLLQDNAREVRAGDRLIPVQAQPYDLQFVPHPPSAQAMAAGLRVLAVADALSAAGPRDVIAISGGRREGIDNGSVVSLRRHGTRVNNRVLLPDTSRADDGFTGDGGGTVALPDEYAAHAMVFRTFDKVSYALVMDGVKPVRVGDEVRPPDAH